jgi:hypothetical protein
MPDRAGPGRYFMIMDRNGRYAAETGHDHGLGLAAARVGARMAARVAKNQLNGGVPGRDGGDITQSGHGIDGAVMAEAQLGVFCAIA